MKHFLNSIAGCQDYESQKDVLNSFITHIENDPVERIKANKEGAVKILLAVQEKCKEYTDIVKRSKLALALLGHPGSLPSDGIRILTLDGGGKKSNAFQTLTNLLIFQILS